MVTRVTVTWEKAPPPFFVTSVKGLRNLWTKPKYIFECGILVNYLHSFEAKNQGEEKTGKAGKTGKSGKICNLCYKLHKST